MSVLSHLRLIVRLMRAEALRMRRAPFAQWLIALSILIPLLFLVPAGLSSDDVDLRMPYLLQTLPELLSIALLFPLMLAAWAFGVDQASDTWKLLLVRAPVRWAHLLAKLVVVDGIVAVASLALIAVNVIVCHGIGLAFEGLVPTKVLEGASAVRIEQAVVALFSVVLMNVTMTSLASALSSTVRKSGMVIAPMVAFALVLIANQLGTAISPFEPSRVVAGWLLEAPLHPSEDPLSTEAALASLVAWKLAPIVVMIALFRFRDVESGVG